MKAFATGALGFTGESLIEMHYNAMTSALDTQV